MDSTTRSIPEELDTSKLTTIVRGMLMFQESIRGLILFVAVEKGADVSH